MLDPQVPGAVHQAQVDGQHGEQPHGARKLNQGLVPLARELVLHGLGDAEPVDHPAEHGPEDLVVQEVDGEGDAAEPQERLAGEHVPDRRGEVDGHDDQVEADARGETGQVGVAGEDGSHEVGEPLGPGLPLEVDVGQRGDVEADDEEGGRDGDAQASQAVLLRQHPGPRGARTLGKLLEVGHEGAEEELHAEEGVVGGQAEDRESHGNHHSVLRLYVCRGEQVDVNPEGALHDGHHRPQLSSVVGLSVAPYSHHVLEEDVGSNQPVVLSVGARFGEAGTIAVVCSFECSELRCEAAECEDQEDGQHETGYSAECRPADGVE